MSNYRRARAAGGCYFFTVVTYRRQELLLIPDHLAVLRSVVKHVRAELPFAIEAWIVLPDHIHCIWTLPPGDRDFSKRWGLIKVGFTKRVAAEACQNASTPSRFLRHEGNIWQRRFWEHQIRDEEDFRLHMDYVHYNPVKHGFVAQVREWPHSTFHRCVRDGLYPADWGSIEPRFQVSRDFGE